jgi:hypothetical protein
MCVFSCLLNHAISIENISSNDRWIGRHPEGNNHDLLEILSQHFLGVTEEYRKKLQSVSLVFRLGFELNNSRILV